MRFMHLSDLHLGKRINEFPMLEDQEYILSQILTLIDQEKPNGVIIAGDVYDRSVPGEDAVKLLDRFLTNLAQRNILVFMIYGNHDSAVKLSFASELISHSGIYIAPVYQGEVTPLEVKAGEELVRLYLLPFIKPVTVRALFPEEEVNDYTDAVKAAISHMKIDPNVCNVLVAHQFVAGAERSESEECTVGGLDRVDPSVFAPFDYVALGHIHGPQHVGRDTIRYCGTPLKYSFSEATQKKSVSVIDIETTTKRLQIRTVELKPLRDMRVIKGSFQDITTREYYEKTNTEDYLQITLTDEEEIPDAMAKLRMIYPNTMVIKYDNRRTRENRGLSMQVDLEHKSPLALFDEFYESQNNQRMSEKQREFMSVLIESIWEGNK